MFSKHLGCYNLTFISRRVTVFLGGGGRGTLLLGHAHDEVNHSELGPYSRRISACQKQTLHKYNTNSMFEIKKIPIVHL